MYENDNPVDQLVHLYVDGAINRRDLVKRVARHTGSMAAALAALAGFEELKAQGPAPACPANVRVGAEATDIEMAEVTFPSEDGTMITGYQAWPKGMTEPAPGVIALHENQGLVEHHRDVVRRLARAGFIGLGPDLLARQGGTAQFTDPMQRTQAYGRTTQEQRRLDILGALSHLKKQPMIVHDRIGIVGFCAGGGNIWDFIVNIDELAAAVPFYGAPPADITLLTRIKTPVLSIYAELDRALTMRLLPVANEMIRLEKTFGVFVYEGTRHAFHNDTGAVYEPAAACDAWARTVSFFNKHLRAPRG